MPMKLIELVEVIEEIAKNQPNVNQILRDDIYDLNTLQDIKYSVFCSTQQQHQEEGDFMTYNFVFFYVDRLMSDRSNQTEIQSTGIAVLSNILHRLEDYDVEVKSHSYQVFHQRFNDECAGVYVTVGLTIPTDYTCGETYYDGAE